MGQAARAGGGVLSAVRMVPFADIARAGRKTDPKRSADVAYLRLLLVLSDDRLRTSGPDWIKAHWLRIARRRGSWSVIP